MAVSHDIATESHGGTTGSTGEASFSWSHGGASSGVKGVLVFTFNNTSTTAISTGVTYGGSALTAVTGGAAVDSAGEQGRCTAWFLGTSVPQGTQTVVVDRVNNAAVLYAVAITVLAAADTETNGVVLLQGDQALAEQNVDDGSPGTNSLRYAGTFSGLPTPPAAGASSTALHSIDLGALGDAAVRETTAGQGSRPVGFSATTDDVAAVHLAVREVAVTRFRLTADATAPAVSPAFQSYTHTQGSRRQLLFADASTLATQAYSPDVADHHVAGDAQHVQFVSDPLAAGIVFTAAAVLKFCVQVESAGASTSDFQLVQLFVGVVSEDGSTAQATLRSKVTQGTALGTFQSRFLSTTLSGSYTTVSGDRLVVEFSTAGTPSAGSNVNGHNGQIRWGSSGAGGDLAETSSQTGTTLNPWIEFASSITAAPAGATGTVAVTQADQTSTASGVETFAATSTQTQADQTSTASGTVANPLTGTVAVIQADQTSTASGLETITGTVAVTQADQTSTATGSVLGAITGTVAVTQADQTSTAAAVETITGSSAATQADQTSTATGVFGDAVSGTVAATQADQTSTASGSIVLTIVGTVAVVQADQTSTATAVETFTGTSANVQADQTSTATGTALVAVTGTVAVTQDNQFSTASGFFGQLTFWSTNPAGYTANPAAFVRVGAGDTPPAW